MPALELVWNLIARDEASPAFARAGAAAEGASAAVGGLLKVLGPVAIGAAFYESIKAAGDFQRQMLLVQTQAGATAQEVADMSPKILTLAGQVAQAPEALATSLYHVESTGLRGAQALEAVRIAAEGAKVGHADLEQTTNALTATIASGMLPATETYAQAMGQLNTIVGSGDMKMQDLNDALASGLLVTVKQYGVNLNDVGAALADFGDNNIRGADAATRVRMAVQAIAAPGKAAGFELGRIGLTVKDLSTTMEQHGLNAALTLLHDHLVKSGIAANEWGDLLTQAFTKKAGAGVVTLMGTFDRFEQKYTEVSKGANTFGDAWEATTKSANFQFAALGDSMEALGIKIGTAVLPYVADLAKHVGDFVQSQGFQDFLSTVGNDAVIAGRAIGALVSGFGALPGPVKDVTLALAGMAIAEKIGLFSALTSGVERLGAGVAALPGRLTSGFTPMILGIAAIGTAVLASNDEIDAWAKGLEQGGQAAQTATDQMTRAHDASILDAHSVSDAWDIVSGAFADGLAQIEGYGSALDMATQKAQDWYNSLPLMQRVQQDVTSTQNDLNQAIDDYGQNSSAAKYQAWLLGLANDSLKVNQQELKVAADGLNGSLAGQVSLQQQLSQSGLSLDQATLNVSQSISNYKKVSKDAKATDDDRSQSLYQVEQNMYGVLDAAKKKADAETQGLPQSIVTNQEIVRQRDALDAVVKKLGFVPPALQEMYDSLNGPTAQALEATKTDINKMGTAMTTVSNQDINGNFLPALDKMATAAGTTVPRAITGGFIKSTDDMAGKLNGPTQTAISNTMTWMDAYTTQLGIKVPGAVYGPFVSAQDQAKVHMDMTGGQADITSGKVSTLGQIIAALPPAHNTNITADATQANATIDNFLKRMQSDGFVGAAFNLTPMGTPAPSGGLIGLPPVGNRATGGAIHGPGSGTSDTAGIFALSNGEHVWTAAEVSAAGGHAAVEGMRQMVLAAGHGLAGGGPVPSQVSYPFDFNTAAKAGMNARVAAQAAAQAAASAMGGVPASRAANEAAVNHAASYYGWSGGPQWDALVRVIMRESGFNNVAQNPTSTAYGMFQFLNSTWGGLGGSKTSDPAEQARLGMMYIFNRYNSPLGALAHENSFGWYRNGTNYVPSDQLAYLHRGEAVVPAAVNQGAPYKADRSAPLIGEAHFHNEVDAELLLRRVEFQQRGSVFG